jgi:hypothetical protein
MRIAEDAAHCRDPGGGFVAIAIESLLRMRHVPQAILNGTRTWSPMMNQWEPWGVGTRWLGV